MLGKRLGYGKEALTPHSLTMTMIGASLLWFGWFGFNAGSALGANGLAAQAFINTHLAAASAMCTWLLVERFKGGHATTLGAASGAVAGLVAITPCAGFVGGLSPLFIGGAAGVVCYLALSLKTKFGFDDSLDVIGVHLVGGILGSLLLGVFADTAVNPGGFDGLLQGGTELMKDQIVATLVTLAFSGVMSFVIAKVIDMTIGLRVTAEDEDTGLDLSQHAETAYSMGGRL
jgi:ammonium transporter, Amt family